MIVGEIKKKLDDVKDPTDSIRHKMRLKDFKLGRKALVEKLANLFNHHTEPFITYKKKQKVLSNTYKL